MKLKNALLASTLFSVTAFSINAATELMPEQAVATKPSDRVVVTGRFNVIDEAVKTVSRYANREGAAPFYAVDTPDFDSSGNWRVAVDLYKADAEKVEETSNHVINGVVELPKDQAVLIEPSGVVTVQGFYRSQPEVNDITTKAAKTKGAYSFYIVRQADVNQGGNQRITALIYKKDVKKRIAQSPDVISADSEAGCATLVVDGEVAKEVEIPGVMTAASPSSEVGRSFETQPSKGGRHTVTLPDGTKVGELSKVTVAMMVPFDSIKFSDNYGDMTEVSYQITKRVTKRDAKYYHIARQRQERGNNLTASVDLYR